MAKRTKHQIAVDDALTKDLNQHDAIHDFLQRCTAELCRRFEQDGRVFFYLKGSAALARYLLRWRVPVEQVNQICARSDWDTQLVINPLLPRAQWFAAFKDCQVIIRECLDQFEEDLLAVLVDRYIEAEVDPHLLARSEDREIRRQQNLLAQQVRNAVADDFARVFVETVAGFIALGPEHWNLDWDVARALVQNNRRRELLELDIQASTQATLTSALIHPAQLLDNLASVMTDAEVARLTQTTATVAAEAWQRMSDAVDEYDQLFRGFINANPDLVGWVVERLPRDEDEAQVEVVSIDSVHVDQDALEQVLTTDHAQILLQLTDQQRERLTTVQTRIDTELEQYTESPDPEEVAEAERREIEGLAPFTLVAREKGGRKTASILENMTIRDFYLFRLMIKCQISNRDPENRLMPDAPTGVDFDTFRQQFRFRAELLDVSVPRDDSLESAEQWAHTRHQIAVHDHLPLPNGEYFLDEYMLMFREALDKKSSSAHKLTKRLNRACLIARVHAAELQDRGGLRERLVDLAGRYPVYGALMQGQNPPPANGVVILRMFEQLVESYDFAYDPKLAADATRLMTRLYNTALRRLLNAELTHATFLELMQIYNHVGEMTYNQTFALATYRRRLVSDDRLLQAAQRVVTSLRGTFGNRIRCGVVEDFAIAADPDLPATLIQRLPRNVLKILVHAAPQDRGEVLAAVRLQIPALRDLIPGLPDPVPGRDLTPGRTDVVEAGGVLYFRINQQSDGLRDEDRTDRDMQIGPAIYAKVEVVTEAGIEWVVPAHAHDLKAIVKQYRRSLPRYTEYTALAKRKEVLRLLETALTTY
jgi:hypothetical protein